RLAGFLTVAVAVVFDHPQRLLDLLEKLPLAIARAQLQRVFLFQGRAIRRIGRDLVLAQMLAGVIGVVEELRAQLEEALLEESQLRLVHVIALRRLQEVLLGQFFDFFYDALCCHIPTYDAFCCHVPTFPQQRSRPRIHARPRYEAPQAAVGLLEETVNYSPIARLQASLSCKLQLATHGPGGAAMGPYNRASARSLRMTAST